MTCLIIIAVIPSIETTLDRQKYDECLVVNLDSGRAQGVKIKAAYDKEVFAFLGIPFARPPIGELRFAKPKCVKPWKDIFNATHKRFPCIQPDFHGPKNFTIDGSNGTEDCLHINVWVPATRRCIDRNAMHTVMVYFYGGSFQSGANSWDLYDGRFIASFGEVIVVTPNYRVNAFGFLKAGTDDAPGNVGLHDQILALKWIEANIASFGGNPRGVVPFGQSAGAISVSFQMVTPRLSQYAYHRYIVMSAAAYTPLPSNTGAEADKNLRSLALSTGCHADNNRQMLNCLRKLDVSAIYNVIKENKQFFMPSYYDDVLPDLPTRMIRRFLKTKNKEMLVGVTAREGVAFFEILFYDVLGKNFTVDARFLKSRFPDAFGTMGEGVINFALSVLNIVYDIYSPTYDGIKELIGDSIFVCPTQYFTKRFAEKGGRAYFYVFNPKPSFTVFGGDVATHGDDVLYLFGVPFLYTELATALDRNVSWNLINLWTNYAKTG